MSYSSDPFSSAMMSLPTPPGTSHREEKENRSSFSDALSESNSRVSWSDQNEYHTVISSVLPPKLTVGFSGLKRPPTKSILKKSTVPLLPSIQENQREDTPEPDDPLVDLHYLEGPVSRIIATDALLHDLIEAYSILAARIRACIGGSTEGDSSWPFFQPLRKHRDKFVDAVVRDLGRALEDPLKIVVVESEPEPEVEHELAPEEHDRTYNMKGLPSPKESPKKKKRGMSDVQVKHARDLSTTCQAVLKLLGTISVLPSTYQVFSDEQLGRMLTQVLAIPLADSLPTPNARKTCALSIWLLQVQRFPDNVLLPASDRIAYAVRRGLDGELGKEGKKGSVSDGLKAIHDLSVCYPEIFVPAFAPILPSIFQLLLGPTLGFRALACHALGGFAFGSASLPTSVLHTRIADLVVGYLMTPRTSSPTKRTPSPLDDPPIVRTLRGTLKATEPLYAAQGPVWALCVLAHLVVLLRSATFIDIKLTKCLTALFTLAMKSQKSSVRALGCLVWRAMTWAYFQPPPVRLPRESQDDDEEPQSEADEDLEEDTHAYQRRLTMTWRVIHSVVDMGAGLSTIGALLAKTEDDDNHSTLRRALHVLSLMSKKGGPTCQDALDLACHLMTLGASTNNENREIGEPHEWNPMKLLAPPLFSCSPGLMTAEFKSLAPVVKPIFEYCPQVEDVRWLNEDELSLEWVYDSLIGIWKEGLRALRLFWGCKDLPEEIQEIWRRLIRARVNFTTEAGDDDAVAQVADRAVDVLIELLEDKTLDLRPCTDADQQSTVLPCSPRKSHKSTTRAKGPSFSRMRPALLLFLVHHLWLTLKDTIPESSLNEAAGKMLGYMMAKEVDILGRNHGADEVHEYYANFCASVAISCDISDLDTFWTFGKVLTNEGQKRWEWPVDVRVAIWTQFMWKFEDDKASWESGIVLLSVPFRLGCAWDMNAKHLNQWDLQLRRSIDRALDYGVDSPTVLDQVCSAIAAQKGGVVSSLIRVADLLLSHLDISEVRCLPEELFEVVNNVLLRSYPPPSDDVVPSMWLIRSLTRSMDTCPVTVSRGLLEKIQDGLAVWISDEFNALSSEDYSFNILPLFQTLLLGIQSLPTTIDVLETFAPVIASGLFGGSKKPSGMTETFREFWETSEYSNILTDSKRMPKEIVSCLELLRGPIEPPTKDITEIDETETSASEHMDVDEVEMHLMQPEEDDIATAMSPEIQEITREAFMLHPVTWEDPESPLQSIKSSKTPSTPKFTPTHISTPPRPQKNTEPSPIPSMPFFVLGPSTPLLSTFPQTPKRLSPKHRPKSGPASNKENRSPTPIPTAASATSEREILARSPGQGVLGKRRSLESIEEEEDMLQKRAQGETSGAKKSRLMKVLQESLELPPSDDDPIVPSPIKALLAKPEVLHASTESKEEVSPPKSKKRKGMFMEAVELPRRFVRRRTESLPEPSTTSHSSSEDTTVPEAPTAPLRRTRSVTRLLGKAAKFERLIHTPKKKARRSLDANLGSERSTGSATLIEAGSSSPLRGLREAMVPGSDDSIMLATPSKYFQPSEMPSSDDLVFLGQVTPRRLVSPAMRRIHEQNMDSDPPSDDSNLSASPTHERVARRSGFKGSTPAPSLFSRSLSFSSGKPSSKILRSTIKRKSISSLFGVDGETLSY